MLPLSMFFLICALCCGVFGFGTASVPVWIAGRTLFFICLPLAIAALVYGVRMKPILLTTSDNKSGSYF